ncbi:MAG: hypothetical protein NTU88_08125, partial [Armatimonadetes bacterium]|nr:hypothetical protein [Armatimonadota bacterium]
MRSKTPLLIVLAALGILGLLTFLGVRSYIRQFTAALPTVIKTELRSRLGRDVRFDSFTMPSSGTAILTNLRVADRRPFGEEAFFFCPRVVIRFKMYDLLMGRLSPVQSVSSITLIHPRLRLIRNAKGEFNAQDLILRQPEPLPMRFRVLLTIDSGTVMSVDYAARIEKLPAVNSLAGLSGTLDFRPEHAVLANLTGRGTEDRFGEMKVVGRWGIDRPMTTLTLDLRDADAPYWSNYLSNVRSWEITEGSIDLHAVVSA